MATRMIKHWANVNTMPGWLSILHLNSMILETISKMQQDDPVRDEMCINGKD